MTKIWTICDTSVVRKKNLKYVKNWYNNCRENEADCYNFFYFYFRLNNNCPDFTNLNFNWLYFHSTFDKA